MLELPKIHASIRVPHPRVAIPNMTWESAADMGSYAGVPIGAKGPELWIGDVRDLPASVLQFDRAVLAVSPSAKEMPFTEDLKEMCGKGIRICEVRSHTPWADVESLARGVAEVGAEAVFALGGGSVIDAAKIIAVYSRQGELFDVPTDERQRVIALPTTFAAAEQTAVAGVTRGDTKHVLRHPDLRPATAIYSPTAYRQMPRSVLRDSAINSLCHAIEVAYSTRANAISTPLAVSAARSLWRSLPRFWQGDEDHLLLMIVASIRVGFTLRDVGVGLAHAVGHVLGARLGISHGQASAAALVPSLEYNLTHSQRALGIVARALQLAEEPGVVTDSVSNWLKDVGWRPPGMDVSALDRKKLLGELGGDFTLPTNPVQLNDQELKGVAEQALLMITSS